MDTEVLERLYLTLYDWKEALEKAENYQEEVDRFYFEKDRGIGPTSEEWAEILRKQNIANDAWTRCWKVNLLVDNHVLYYLQSRLGLLRRRFEEEVDNALSDM